MFQYCYFILFWGGGVFSCLYIYRHFVCRHYSTKNYTYNPISELWCLYLKHWDWTFLNDVHRNCKDGTDSTDEGSLPLYRHQSDRFPSESPSRKLVSGDIQQQLPQRNLIDDLKKANTKLLQTVDRLSRNEAHLKQQLEILERESQKHNGSMSKRSKTDPGAFRGTASFSSKTSDLSCHEQHKNEQLHKNERATRTTGFLTASEQLVRLTHWKRCTKHMFIWETPCRLKIACIWSRSAFAHMT